MNNEPKKDPSARLRNVLGNQSALSHLPKKRNDTTDFMPEHESRKEPSVKKDVTHHAAPEPDPVTKKRRFNFWPAIWTIASVLSLTINLVLAILLFSTWMNLPSLNVNGATDVVTDIGTGVLGGLYTNFEKMDRAHITRTIPVQTTIPVKFDLALNQQTNVVLSQDVTISNALVTVNTGGLNISRALATIVLPQGTTLPVVLNLTVPVDTTVPVSLNVDVDIPLNETQLHDPFVGLRQVVEPYYCMINPEALNLDGQKVCVNK
ncbi:MAG: hypothetical protein HOP27_08025 [Anaerolineales bacterium]|nr:hypothetical protein [Anaerolineales bacterium]